MKAVVQSSHISVEVDVTSPSPAPSTLEAENSALSAGPVSEYFRNVTVSSEISVPLNQKVVQDLMAASPYFDWDILSKEIDGITRSIVILGERHYVNPDIANEVLSTAKSVLAHFNHRALEGVVPDNYIFSKVFSSWNQHVISSSESLKESPSALYLSHQTLAIQKCRQEIQADLSRLVSKHSLEGKVNTLKLSASLAKYRGPVDQETFKEILKEELAKSTNPSSAQQTTPLINGYKLEAEHKPDLLENIEALNLGFPGLMNKYLLNSTMDKLMCISGGIFPFAALGHIFTTNPMYRTLYYATMPPASLCYGLLAASRLYFSYPVFRKNSLKFGEYLADHSRSRRDKTFAATTLEILKNNKDISPLLVQVGKAHVPGLSDRLTQAGWKSVLKSVSQ